MPAKNQKSSAKKLKQLFEKIKWQKPENQENQNQGKFEKETNYVSDYDYSQDIKDSDYYQEDPLVAFVILHVKENEGILRWNEEDNEPRKIDVSIILEKIFDDELKKRKSV